MFRYRSSADEIFQAMRDRLVKTAKAEEQQEIDRSKIILGLDKIANRLEKTGRIQASNIVIDRMIKLAAKPAEDRPTLPPPPTEKLLPEDIDPTSLAPYMRPGERRPFIISELHEIRMQAAEALRDVQKAMISTIKDDIGTERTDEEIEKALEHLFNTLGQELSAIHDMERDGKSTHSEIIERYKNFIDKAKKFIQPDEPEEPEEPEESEESADIGSAKDKDEIRKLLKMLRMFGFSRKDIGDAK